MIVGPNVLVFASPGQPVVEPHLAAHPTDPQRLLGAAMVITDRERPFESARLVSFASADGGAAWSPTLHDAWGYDPWVVFTPAGTAALSWLGTPNRFEGHTPIRLWRSPDGGSSWSAEAEVLPGAFDGAKLTADPKSGRLHVVAASFPAEEASGEVMSIYADRAEPGGAFSLPRRVSQEGAHFGITESAALPDGTLLICGIGNDEAPGLRRSAIWVHRSADGGATFSDPIVVSHRVGRRKGYARLVADIGDGPHQGTVYFVRAAGEPREAGGIWFNRSADGGRTWSPDRRVNQGPEASAEVAMLPSLAINREGVVAVSWVSRESRALGRWGPSRLLLAVSSDGGATFSSPVEVTARPSTPEGSGNGRTAEELPAGGHYMGLAARADGSFQLLWSDSRDGAFAVFTAQVDVARKGEAGAVRGADGRPGRATDRPGNPRRRLG